MEGLFAALTTFVWFYIGLTVIGLIGAIAVFISIFRSMR